MKKCSTVSIIGRPSSGKSTLLNTICENKVSITSPTPQTTRNAIKGIYTDQRGQLIFTDTPGFHLSEKAFNLRLQEIAVDSLDDADQILYMIDPTRESGDEENRIAFILSNVKCPITVCINKADAATASQKEAAASFVREKLPNAEILIASALNDEGVDEILIALFSHASEGELLYAEDQFTDQDLHFRVSEIIREKAMNSTTEELPHAIYVEVSDLEYDKENQKVWIRAFINVEHESQKGILIGKGGANIKSIRVQAFKEIKRIFPGSRLELDLRVKTAGSWRQDSRLVKKLTD
ncbi:MAG: GTPase Era [Sphaerochaetaceae bacterium]|jgi:GTP-binding protein Era|nr:GTPase Era [Sphaerochaetaceae bacterium]